MSVILNNDIYLNSCSSVKKNNTVMFNPSFCSDAHGCSDNNKKSKHIVLSNLPAMGISLQTTSERRINDRIKKLYTKMQEQLNPLTNKEVEHILSSIEKNGATKKEAVYAMNVLTQYGNIQSLVKLGEKLKELDINKFYRGTENSVTFNLCNREIDKDLLKTDKELFVAANLAFDYLYNSKHITELADKDKKKTAVILDEAMFKFLENNPEELSKLKDDENIIFINLEGWNDGLNIYAQGKDDKYIADNASKLIKRAKDIQNNKNISFEEAFNSSINEDVTKRANKLGINHVTVSVNETQKPDIDSIVQNLAPMNVSEKYIYKLINAIGDTIFPDNKRESQKAKILISDYFLSQIEVFSPRRIGDTLKEIHNKILDYASKQYKSDGTPYTEDDIVYIIPSTRKSYDQINLQYALVNDVDFNKFIFTREEDFSSYPNNKIYAVIDDIVATGSSMIHEGFGYSMKRKMRAGNFRHIIMAPVISSKYGYEAIKSEIQNAGRKDIDEVFSNEKNQTIALRKSDFYNNLSKEDKDLFETIIRNLPTIDYDGYAFEGNAILFPYMGPDTNSVMSSFLFDEMIPNPKALKSRYYEHLLSNKKIKELCNEN